MTSLSMIIVGMGPGNGRAIARRFGREGYALGLIARCEDRLRRQASDLADHGCDVTYRVADSADLEALTAAIHDLQNSLGPVDVVVFNAYAATADQPSELAASQLAADLAINAVAPLAAAQAVLPGMRTRGTGAILLTGGGLALQPTKDAASLSIGKAAIRTLAFVLNEELRDFGIRAGTVTIAGYVGQDIATAAVAEAFWTMAQDRCGAMEAEVILAP